MIAAVSVVYSFQSVAFPEDQPNSTHLAVINMSNGTDVDVRLRALKGRRVSSCGLCIASEDTVQGVERALRPNRELASARKCT